MDSRKAFAAGVVVGAGVMFIAAATLFGLRRYEQRKAEQARIVMPYDQLPALQFPDVTKLPDYGNADGDWKFRTLDGKAADLSEFRGKTVFLGFWATWCSDCRREFASIDSLRNQLGKRYVRKAAARVRHLRTAGHLCHCPRWGCRLSPSWRRPLERTALREFFPRPHPPVLRRRLTTVLGRPEAPPTYKSDSPCTRESCSAIYFGPDFP